MLKTRVLRLALLCFSILAVAPRYVYAIEEDMEDESAYSESELEAGAEESPDVELNLDKTKSDKKTIIRTVRRSDSLLGIFLAHGFTHDDANYFLSLPSWPRHYTLVPGARYLVSTFKDTKDAELVFFIPRSSQVLKLGKVNNKTEFSLSDLNFELRVKQVTGEVQGSLLGSIRKMVPDSWVPLRFIDAYALDYKLDQMVKSKSRFVITYEEKLLNGQYVAPGEVLYTSIEMDGQKQERFFLKTPSGGSFLAMDADHDMRPFFSPIEYMHISSPFNPKRFHPIRRRRIPHRGTDFALNHGSPVYAALDGTVSRIARNKAAGMFVILQHRNGYQTDYVHLSEIDPKIQVGSEVQSGQKLGEVGCTGFCTRPHLHFGISKNGKFINPIKLMRPYTFAEESKIKSLAECLATKSPNRSTAAQTCDFNSNRQ